MLEIKKDTIIRTVLLIIALINQVLTSCGKPIFPIDNEALTELLSNLFTIFTAIWAWWKNNSFTYEALVADEELKEMRKK